MADSIDIRRAVATPAAMGILALVGLLVLFFVLRGRRKATAGAQAQTVVANPSPATQDPGSSQLDMAAMDNLSQQLGAISSSLSTQNGATQPTGSPAAGGGPGTSYVIGTERAGPGGYGIWDWANGKWNQMPGAAVKVWTDTQGTPWVINAQGQIYEWMNSQNQWQAMPGSGFTG